MLQFSSSDELKKRTLSKVCETYESDISKVKGWITDAVNEGYFGIHFDVDASHNKMATTLIVYFKKMGYDVGRADLGLRLQFYIWWADELVFDQVTYKRIEEIL